MGNMKLRFWKSASRDVKIVLNAKGQEFINSIKMFHVKRETFFYLLLHNVKNYDILLLNLKKGMIISGKGNSCCKSERWRR